MGGTPISRTTSAESRALRPALVVLALSAALGLGGAAHGATLVVTNLNDAGAGSLRQAIIDAAAGDSIEFGVIGTIVLTSGTLVIDKNLNIHGPGQDHLRISGNNASRVLHVQFGSVFISGVTIRDGFSVEGAGIRNEAALTLFDTAVRNNEATIGGGAGILNSGTLSLGNTTVRENNVTSGSGAGIANDGGTVTLRNATVSNNRAANGSGGILNLGAAAALFINNSTISENGAGNNSGGIFNGGTLRITHSTITNNSAASGGGIFNSGVADLTNTIVANSPSGNDCAGAAVISLGHNLDSDGSCGLTGVGDLSSMNPLLAPLANYGGPTATHALMGGSPAIDHVPLGSCFAGTDQRGVARPQGPACEIGSYELGAPCTLLLDLSYIDASATLEIDFTVGTLVPASWNVWLSVQTSTISLWSVAIPPIDPSVPVPLTVAFPQIGTIGMLTTLTTPNDGIICSAWTTVDTGP